MNENILAKENNNLNYFSSLDIVGIILNEDMTINITVIILYMIEKYLFFCFSLVVKVDCLNYRDWLVLFLVTLFNFHFLLMSFCATESKKHKICFLKKEDALPKLGLQDYFEIDKKYTPPGFRLPNGQYNWHCSCVASYISGPCGVFFKNFLSNIDTMLKDEDGLSNAVNLKLFKSLQGDMMGCMKKHPGYYKTFMDDFGKPMESLINEDISKSIRSYV